MTVATRLQQVLAEIHAAEKQFSRTPNSVHLLAVSKQHSIEKIREAYQAGQRLFGENYVQEALEKQDALRDLAIEWHFIGTIQSNKTKQIAQCFDWVHSINRLTIAKRLHEQRPVGKPPLNICIEVNVDVDDTKSGIMIEDLEILANAIRVFNRLRFRGLMVIPKIAQNKNSQYMTFQKAAELQYQLNQRGFMLDTLSMGMSSDFTMAIKAGSTMVRVGTAIFGERKKQ